MENKENKEISEKTNLDNKVKKNEKVNEVERIETEEKVKKIIKKAKENGKITYGELASELDNINQDQIEKVFDAMEEIGVDVLKDDFEEEPDEADLKEVEDLSQFYEELESENRGSLQDMEKMQSVDLNYWLPGDILQKADKMSMAHSLEVRVPFLDKEVFNFAAKLPKEAKIAAGTTKYIFRKAVSEFLPQETNERKKLGFPIPIRVWLRQNDWYQMVTDLFTSKEAEEFFHTEKLLQLLNDHKDKKADNSRKIWTVLTFLIWYDRFFTTCSK